MTPVKLSKQAQQEIQQIFDQKKIPDGFGLRLTVVGGGCAGVSHKLGFDQKTETDLSYTEYGFEIIIAKKDLMHLLGKRVDFVETTDKRGFVFEDEEN
jgi:iron-sulfur cluster assembly protein